MRKRAEGEAWGVRGEAPRRIWDEGCVVVFDSHLQKKKKENTKGSIRRSRVMEGRTERRWVEVDGDACGPENFKFIE